MSEIIASVSGVRGIIGDSLTPANIIKFTSAFSEYCKIHFPRKNKIVIGRDGREFGEAVESIVIGNLSLCGFEIVNIGIAPTPTVQLATEMLNAAGGISITASHNPQIWNGLKFLNDDGIFLDESQMNELINIASRNDFKYSGIDDLKKVSYDPTWIKKHIKSVLDLKILNVEKIKEKKFKVVVDAVNSSGSEIIPSLLEQLGCDVIKLYCDGSGKFPHTPEPLPENLSELSSAVIKNKADIGLAIDPDADRLVLITDTGEPFSEENTVVTAINFVLKNTEQKKRIAAVNLSTTRAAEDIAKKHSGKIFRSPVGEINVVREMQKSGAVIGGEGSGGVILPELHYGRDSVVAVAIILNELADFVGKLSDYKKQLPQYFIAKTKIENIKSPDLILKSIEDKYKNEKDVTGIYTNDGLKIDFTNCWVHMRKSNTEPIIRIITEAKTMEEAVALQQKFLKEIPT